MPMSTLKDAFKLAALAGAAFFAAHSFAALPELKVTTRNNATITAQSANRQGAGNCQSTNTFSHKYVAMTMTLTDAAHPANNITVTDYKDSIRGRGNSTWNVDKKPYRIKFAEHKSMFGSKKHKSWALLANWYDPTFALNAVGFELGRRLGLPGTPGYYFVDLYINNSYKGIYQMTDLVQVNKGRVEVDEKEGWLAEFDYHCPSDADEIDFNTNNPSGAKLHTFIKSPEDLPKVNGQDPYKFVKDQINALTDAMFTKQGFPTNGYRDLIDLESMAKYVMIQMFMDNFDFNNKAMAAGTGVGGSKIAEPGSNFMHKDKGKMMVAGPLWDLDLAAGVDNQQNFPKHYQYYNSSIKPKHPFYLKFFDDPVFLAKWKKAYDNNLNVIRAMTGVMDSIANIVEGSVEKNFALQNGGGGGGCIQTPYGCIPQGGGFPGMGGMTPDAPATKQAYRDGVNQLKTWWNNRINFYTQELNKMNIDVSKDINQHPPTSVAERSLSARNGLSVVKNGLRINASGKASVKVFSLTGNVVRKQMLTAGNHTVALGDLPRGMYVAKVSLDGVKQTVRVAVR